MSLCVRAYMLLTLPVALAELLPDTNNSPSEMIQGVLQSVDVLVDLICAELFLGTAAAVAVRSTDAVDSISMCMHSSRPPLDGLDE